MADAQPQQQQQLVRPEQLGKLFGLGIDMIYRLVKDGVLINQSVKGETGKMYPFIDNIQRYIAYLRDKAGARGKVSDALNEVKLQEAEMKARQLEIALNLKEGSVHTTEDVKRVMNSILGAFKSRLLTMPQTVAPKLVNVPNAETAATILADEVDLLCGLLRAYNKEEFYARNVDYVEGLVSADAADASEEGAEAFGDY
jgi:phage terminase Nu1 subunit (DNA packaging protein)